MRAGSFEKVSVLLFDRQHGVRRATRSALMGLGFRDIKDTPSFADFERLVRTGAYDLVISDIEDDEGDVCGLVKNIRHSEIGINPFVVIVLTTWTPAHDLVMRAVESGADDLLGKPLSTGQISGRIAALVRARKRFVVTTDYVGPDRRDGGDRPAEIETIEVPNTLKAVVEDDPAAAAPAAIQAALETINLQKLHRHGVQIGVLASLLRDNASEVAAADQRADLDRLLSVADDLGRRIRGTPYAHIGDLCGALAKIAGSIAAADQPAGKDLDLLEQTAMAIRRAFDPDQDSAAITADIAATVGHIKDRRGRS